MRHHRILNNYVIPKSLLLFIIWKASCTSNFLLFYERDLNNDRFEEGVHSNSFPLKLFLCTDPQGNLKSTRTKSKDSKRDVYHTRRHDRRGPITAPAVIQVSYFTPRVLHLSLEHMSHQRRFFKQFRACIISARAWPACRWRLIILHEIILIRAAAATNLCRPPPSLYILFKFATWHNNSFRAVLERDPTIETHREVSVYDLPWTRR